MAKRRKSKKQPRINIKYEVYGILIIVFSVIALIGEGSLSYMNPVGKALRSICVFIAGHFHFIIPVIFIYVALYVMMKRSWPKKWTFRKTGVLLAIAAILISYHISLFEKPDPDLPISTKLIISNTYTYITEAIVNVDNESPQHIGGGMGGALLYGLLHMFLGYSGTIIMVIAIFIIAFMFITNISLVETLGKVKNHLKNMAKLIHKRWKARQVASVNKKQSKTIVSTTDAPIDLDDDPTVIKVDSDEPERIEEKKKPLFLKLLDSEQSEQSSALEADIDHDDRVIEEDIPRFRDFLEQKDEEKLLAVDSELDPDGVIIKDEDAVTAVNGQAAVDKTLQQEVKPYQLPPFNLLAKSDGPKGGGQSDFKSNARKLETTLESFGVKTKVLEVVRGPAVTRYELQPDIGVKVSRIVSLTDDIALALAAKDIRMEAPIPGKAAIGIEVPNSDVSVVTMREVMESSAFLNSSSKLSVTLGRDISGQPIIGNLAKMPHLLVAGATGSGKSVCINGIIVSILYKAKPDEVKLLMIDPKKVELNVYNGIPHLLAPVVTDPRRASLALKKVVTEMERRYELFSHAGARNIEAYNDMVDADESGQHERLPLIVVIVDELADLMMVAAKDVEDAICRLAQMARAAGIHLIIATQRPSVDVITGLIKANIPSRIAFAVSSQIDSRTILDAVGAEKLLGRGDMLFLPVGASKSIRVQGAFLTDNEVEAVVNFVKEQADSDYDEEMVPEIEEAEEQAEPPEDELFEQAVHIILEAKQASVSLLQRRMRIGYTRAGRLIDSMEAQGIIGPYEGSKPREVLLTMEQYMARQEQP